MAQAEDANVEHDDQVEIEWEEWDGQSPFLHHCIAGSIAGVAEHTLLYPVDTVKTHMQAYCSTCPNNPANMGASNAASSNVCTSTAVSSAGPTSSSSHATTATTTSTRLSPPTSSVNNPPNGMISTMKNLIQYGHSTQPINNISIKASLNSSRQAATLTAHDLLSNPMNSTNTTTTPTKQLKLSNGYARLFRGIQTMAVGCIPAHALYFSSYEYTKSLFTTTTTTTTTTHSSNQTTTTTQHTHLGPLGASCAGAISTFLHDLVMTPLDTIKQRMQLGHYKSMGHAFSQIVQLEGWGGLYRSFGVTVFTNMPYGMVMVSTNEFLRQRCLEWKASGGFTGFNNNSSTTSSSSDHAHYSTSQYHHQQQVLDIPTTLLAGCGAGLVAAAVTTPLDRVKTRLQTQNMATQLPIDYCPKAMSLVQHGTAATTTAAANANAKPQYVGWNDAFTSIVKEEGAAGLLRGMVPRLCTHAPAVAISWTAYESAKKWLLSSNN